MAVPVALGGAAIGAFVHGSADVVGELGLAAAGVIADTVIGLVGVIGRHVLDQLLPARRIGTNPRVVERAISQYVASSAKSRHGGPSRPARELAEQLPIVGLDAAWGATRLVAEHILTRRRPRLEGRWSCDVTDVGPAHPARPVRRSRHWGRRT